MSVSLKIHIEPLPKGFGGEVSQADAFEELYRRCFPQLVDLCRRCLCGRGDPEAIAQEAFVRAWTSLDRYSGARPFWPWVATIARRLCIDHRRRLQREATHLHVAAAVNERAPACPDEIFENDEESRSAIAALRQLKPSEQRVITLRELNGWSYDEIAQFEGVTVESVRGSLKRARASLRRTYSKVTAGAPVAVSIGSLRKVGTSLRRATTDRAVSFMRHGGALSYGVMGDAAAAAVTVALALGVMPSTSTADVGPDATSATSAPGHALVSSLPNHGGAAERPGAAAGGPKERAGRDDAGALAPPIALNHVQSADDVVFTAVTPSPAYERDRTVFGVGSAKSGCVSTSCSVLFKSTDAGATWAKLGSRGFTGGTVLLPSNYPADPRVFVSGPTALHVSTDGGETFDSVAAIGGAAAISPTFATDRRILLGQAPGWEYADGQGLVRPSGMVVPSVSLSTSPAFSPDFGTDGTIFIGATTVSESGQQKSAVFRCDRSLCDRHATALDSIGVPSVAVAPAAAGGLVVAWRGDRAFVSSDRGRTFVESRLPLAGYVRSVAFDGSRVLVAVRTVDGASTVGGVAVSEDGGRTWSVLGAGTTLSSGVESVVALADGRILAAPSVAGGGGLLCSADRGKTWRSRCGG